MPRLYQRRGKTLVMDRVDPHAFDGACAFCGKLEELRPVGPNNESICFDCAMKDEATTDRKMAELMGGAD
jgi:hypothetical protein